MKCSGINVATGEPVEVTFEQTITSVEPVLGGVSEALYLAPSWIDLQVNGFGGVDFNSPEASGEAVVKAIRMMFASGVTRFYPTVITGSPEDMTGALRNLAKLKEELPEGPAMEGYHVEGPHISPDDGPRGAHPKRWVRPPDIAEFDRMQDAARGGIRLLTLSPEWPEAPRYIEELVRRGIVASIGHTNANSVQVADAVKAGATFSTHLGNGAHLMIPRHPNYIWDQLAEERLSAGLIVDGIHLPGAFIRVALRAKGLDHVALVTDATMTAGCAPGRYRLGEQDVDLTPENKVVLAGSNILAGSALRMDRGVENLMKLASLSLADAVTMATRNPARMGRIAGRQRGLTPGDRGDLVQFRFDKERKAIEVLQTWMSGKLVYSVN